MIYFFYGEDDFRIKQRLNHLEAHLSNTNAALDVQTRLAADLTLNELQGLVMTQSFLSRSRLIVIHNPVSEGSEEFRAGLVNFLSQPLPEGVMIVFVERSPDRRTQLFKFFNKFIAEGYPKLKSAEAREWLRQQVIARGMKCDSLALDLLANSFSDDLWRMNQELDKLSLFAAGQLVDQQMVGKVVPRLLTDDIFATIESLAKKDFAAANKLINRQLLLGMDEQRLLSMIAYQFRNIVLIKSWLNKGAKIGELPAKAQLHPYVVQKTAGLAKSFSIAELAAVFYLLQRVDGAIKKGLTPPRVGLDILTAQIVSA